MKPDATGHLAAYRRAFGDGFCVAPRAVPARLIAVLFTNRCGSMLFTEMVGSSPDIVTRYEVFNGEVVTNKCRAEGLTDLASYLGLLFGRPRVTYTAKIHLGQLGFLAETGLLGAFAGGIEFHLVQRRDQIAQAVSHSIARQTGRWTSFTDADSREAGYSFDEIRKIQASIQAEHAHFRQLAARLDLRVTEVVFEEFLADPGPVLSPIWSRLGLRPGRLSTADTRHRRQATSLNADFARRFREELERQSAA